MEGDVNAFDSRVVAPSRVWGLNILTTEAHFLVRQN
ncbi:hypothetical protein B6N60_02136 [Richelia sinica FACHB-800]|uniref:Uncharacterized protein n=1 Tax=Richelia sinica FACHB-800 TaxID=1357546 RepID=A0A975Y4R0_9NOST|nr:hypothetical protein B6N60_02136 [Richelia sinica FACHB-800]